MKTVDYKKHPPGFIVTKETMDVILEENKQDQLIALYLFYGYTSVWQNTLQVRATTNYTAKGIGWSEQKVRQVKKRLIDLGLIADAQTRNGKHITGHYVRIFYYPTHSKNQRVAKQGDKCLGTNSNKCLGTNTCTPKRGCSRKTIIEKFDKVAATKLYNIILTKKNVKLNIANWPNTFRLLRTTNRIPKERIKKVLIWYGHHIGEDFVPVAYGARTFRDKFTRIEDAMKRSKQDKSQKESHPSYRRGGDGEMGYFEDEE